MSDAAPEEYSDCAGCHRPTPRETLDGRRWNQKRVKAPLCDACAERYDDLLPYMCDLTPREEQAGAAREAEHRRRVKQAHPCFRRAQRRARRALPRRRRNADLPYSPLQSQSLSGERRWRRSTGHSRPLFSRPCRLSSLLPTTAATPTTSATWSRGTARSSTPHFAS